MDYRQKYLKYKAKYLKLRQFGGGLREIAQKCLEQNPQMDKYIHSGFRVYSFFLKDCSRLQQRYHITFESYDDYRGAFAHITKTEYGRKIHKFINPTDFDAPGRPSIGLLVGSSRESVKGNEDYFFGRDADIDNLLEFYRCVRNGILVENREREEKEGSDIEALRRGEIPPVAAEILRKIGTGDIKTDIYMAPGHQTNIINLLRVNYQDQFQQAVELAKAAKAKAEAENAALPTKAEHDAKYKEIAGMIKEIDTKLVSASEHLKTLEDGKAAGGSDAEIEAAREKIRQLQIKRDAASKERIRVAQEKFRQ